MTRPRRARSAGQTRADTAGRTGGAPRALGSLMPSLTRRALGKYGFSSATLISDWETVVGAALASECQPTKLAFPRGKREGGTLHLIVAGGAALEIQHIAPQLVERINSHLGYRAVGQLKLVQGRLPRPRGEKARRPAHRRRRSPDGAGASPALGGIDDPALRDSLLRLARAIAERESDA